MNEVYVRNISNTPIMSAQDVIIIDITNSKKYLLVKPIAEYV